MTCFRLEDGTTLRKACNGDLALYNLCKTNLDKGMSVQDALLKATQVRGKGRSRNNLKYAMSSGESATSFCRRTYGFNLSAVLSVIHTKDVEDSLKDEIPDILIQGLNAESRTSVGLVKHYLKLKGMPYRSKMNRKGLTGREYGVLHVQY